MQTIWGHKETNTILLLGKHRLQNHTGCSNFRIYQLHPFCIPHSSWTERSIKPQEENGYSVSHNAGVHLPLWEGEIMKTGKTIKVAHRRQSDIPRSILRKVKRPLGIWLQLRRWARENPKVSSWKYKWQREISGGDRMEWATMHVTGI